MRKADAPFYKNLANTAKTAIQGTMNEVRNHSGLKPLTDADYEHAGAASMSKAKQTMAEAKTTMHGKLAEGRSKLSAAKATMHSKMAEGKAKLHEGVAAMRAKLPNAGVRTDVMQRQKQRLGMKMKRGM